MGAVLCSTESRAPIPADEQDLLIRPDDLAVAHNPGKEKLVRRLRGSPDRSEDLTQGTAERFVQAPSGESLGDRVQEQHQAVGVGCDHGVGDAGECDTQQLVLRLLGIEGRCWRCGPGRVRERLATSRRVH